MRMSITVSPASDLEVTVAEDDAAGRACETSWMKLLAQVRFEILAFDAAVAGIAQRSVELVVVLFTVWRVLEDIKLRCRKGIGACSADKAMLVVASSKATRRILHGLSNDRFGAPATVAFARSFGSAHLLLLRFGIGHTPRWAYIDFCWVLRRYRVECVAWRRRTHLYGGIHRRLWIPCISSGRKCVLAISR